MENRLEFVIEKEKKLIIGKEIYEKMNKYKQMHFYSKESGGCLIGKYYKSGDIEITDCTTPYPKDKSSFSNFKRRDKKHLDYIDKLKRESNGNIGYIGNWHTHPQDNPKPSFVDEMSWKDSLKKETDNLPLIFIIIGRDKSNIWIGYPKRKLIVKADLLKSIEIVY